MMADEKRPAIRKVEVIHVYAGSSGLERRTNSPREGSGKVVAAGNILVGLDGELSIILPIERSGESVVGDKIIPLGPATAAG